MDFCKDIISWIIDLLTTVYGASGFSDSILIVPFVFWFIRQIVNIFKWLIGVSY